MQLSTHRIELSSISSLQRADLGELVRWSLTRYPTSSSRPLEQLSPQVTSFPIEAAHDEIQRPKLLIPTDWRSEDRPTAVPIPTPAREPLYGRVWIEECSQFLGRKETTDRSLRYAPIEKDIGQESERSAERKFCHQRQITARIEPSTASLPESAKAYKSALCVVQTHLAPYGDEPVTGPRFLESKIAFIDTSLLAAGINDARPSIAQHDVVLAPQHIDALGEHRRVATIIGRCPLEEAASGGTSHEIPVAHGTDVSRLPYVPYACVSTSQFGTYLGRPIGRCIVRDDQFKVRESLRTDALHRLG
jgi:hypothetical protein